MFLPAYQFSSLLQLDPQNPPRAAVATLDRDLDEAYEAGVESVGLLRVAQSWLLENNLQKARAALDKATQRCPCYEKYPDIAVLLKG